MSYPANELLKNEYYALVKALGRYRSILVYVKGSPDPDAIASAFAIHMICETLDIQTEICCEGVLSLPQNSAFVNLLNIPLKEECGKIDIKKFDAYVVVDHPAPAVEGITGIIPCAAHIDHHDRVDSTTDVNFRLIRQDAGATCTILALMLRGNRLAGVSEENRKRLFTALLYGIQTDTDKYSRAGKIDLKAINFLTKLSDSLLLKTIAGKGIDVRIGEYLEIAAENQSIHKDWLMAGIGYIDEHERDVIALIADFLLTRTRASVVTVFALIRKKNSRLNLDASMRTADASLSLSEIIKSISPEGGGRKYKGAYQVNLDYFSECSDCAELWDIVKRATFEKLKKKRDIMGRSIKAKRIKRSIINIFKVKSK